jgi:hypothetical protein
MTLTAVYIFGVNFDELLEGNSQRFFNDARMIHLVVDSRELRSA